MLSSPPQVDNRHQLEPVVTPEQAVKLCDRNFGIGGDGVRGWLYAATAAAVCMPANLPSLPGLTLHLRLLRRSYLRCPRRMAPITACASSTRMALSPRCAATASAVWRGLWQVIHVLEGQEPSLCGGSNGENRTQPDGLMPCCLTLAPPYPICPMQMWMVLHHGSTRCTRWRGSSSQRCCLMARCVRAVLAPAPRWFEPATSPDA